MNPKTLTILALIAAIALALIGRHLIGRYFRRRYLEMAHLPVAGTDRAESYRRYLEEVPDDYR